jgi:hypothetical protein
MKELIDNVIQFREITFADTAGDSFCFVVKDSQVFVKTKKPRDAGYRRVMWLDKKEFVEMMEMVLDKLKE